MSTISTHVLDTSNGKSAAGVAVTLALCGSDTNWKQVGKGVTDEDGRVRSLLAAGEAIASGAYRLTFDTAAYFRVRGDESFFPQVEITFTVRETNQNYHVPLLLSPFSYSTYRGN